MKRTAGLHSEPDDGRSWPGGGGRALHVNLKSRIEAALGERSWKWLADQIGVPQSTLASQVCKPKFSLEVVWRIARVLRLDLQELLGLPQRESDSR